MCHTPVKFSTVILGVEGMGVGVGGTGVGVGRTGVAFGGTGVLVGGTRVSVAGAGVSADTADSDGGVDMPTHPAASNTTTTEQSASNNLWCFMMCLPPILVFCRHGRERKERPLGDD